MTCAKCGGKGIVPQLTIVGDVQVTCPECKGIGRQPTADVVLDTYPIDVSWNGKAWVGPGADFIARLTNPKGGFFIMQWPMRMSISRWSGCKIKVGPPENILEVPSCLYVHSLWVPSVSIVVVYDVTELAEIVGEYFREP